MSASKTLLWALAAVFVNGVVGAAEIYRWVDTEGVVHYSDEAPRHDAEVTTIEFAESRAADYDPLEDPYSIRNQARRINESWAALEQARSEREQAQRQSAQHAVPHSSHEHRNDERYPQPYGYGYGWQPYPPPYWVRPAYPGLGRRQLRAMDELDLTGPRPQSINSGVHHDRVQRSTGLVTGDADRPHHPAPR